MNNRYNRRQFYNKNAAIDKKNRVITILMVSIIALLFLVNYQRQTINELEDENQTTLKEYGKFSKKQIDIKKDTNKIVIAQDKKPLKNVKTGNKPKEKTKENKKQIKDTTINVNISLNDDKPIIVDTLK